MSFLILVLQSIRYAILALALKLFNYAEFIDKYCVCISHQLEYHGISTSPTASCRPALDSSNNQQSEPLHILKTPTRQLEDLHGDTDSSTSNDWSGTQSENHELASDQSSCSSIGSIASAPESTSKPIVSPTQDAPTSVQPSDVSLSAEGSLCPSKPNAFSFSVANARKAAPAGPGNVFSDGGGVCGLGQNDHGVDRGGTAINASSSDSSNEPLVFSSGGTSAIPFTPTIKKDTPTSSQSKAYQSITAMQAYNKYSFEELRFADYGIALQSDSGRRDTFTTTSDERHRSALCAISHAQNKPVMSNIQPINRQLTACRSRSLSVQASPESGLGLHFVAGPISRRRSKDYETVITVLDKTTDMYVRVSEALAWCDGQDRTGLTVTIGNLQRQSLEPLCCPDQVMPSIYPQRTTVTVFIWDTGLRAFVLLEDMLATEALRTRANLRIERHHRENGKQDYSSRCDSTTSRDFIASADLDEIILERLLGKKDMDILTQLKLILYVLDSMDAEEVRRKLGGVVS